MSTCLARPRAYCRSEPFLAKRGVYRRRMRATAKRFSMGVLLVMESVPSSSAVLAIRPAHHDLFITQLQQLSVYPKTSDSLHPSPRRLTYPRLCRSVVANCRPVSQTHFTRPLREGRGEERASGRANAILPAWPIHKKPSRLLLIVRSYTLPRGDWPSQHSPKHHNLPTLRYLEPSLRAPCGREKGSGAYLEV